MKKLCTLLFCLASFSALHAQLPDGSIAPDWTMTDMDGNEWNLYEILAEGKSVLLEFTATWNEDSWEYHETSALIELHNQYGPDGSDELRIFFLEIDDGTDASDLDGTGDDTVGNWLDNTPYPIIDNAEALADEYDAGAPTSILVCPNRLTENVGLASTFSLYQFSQNCLVPGGQNNAGIYRYVGFEGDFCEERTFAPSLIWQNIGSENITSATFELYMNGSLQETLEWSGDLEPFAIDPQAFAPITVTENTVVDMLIASVNGTTDDDDSNNARQIETTIAPATDQNFLTLEILTDDYPTETYWEIRDANGTVFYSGGNPGAFDQIELPGAYDEQNTTYTHEVPLPTDGCYEFFIFDAYGDGICCGYGLGNYRLSEMTGAVLFQGGLFADSEIRPFSLEGASTITNNASISDYIGVEDDVCGEQVFAPIVTLRNQGTAEITSVVLEVSDDAGAIQTFTHNTNLASGQMEEVQLDEITVDASTELIINILSVNGEPDIITGGNTVEAEINRRLVTTPPLTLEIQTDEWGYEIYWEMRTLTGKLVASGGNETIGPDGGGLQTATEDDPGAYPQFELITEQFMLPDGEDACYEFLMVDDWGDGLSGGGFFRLYTEAGDLILNTTFPTGTTELYLVDGQLAPSNVGEMTALDDFSVFPNPVSDDLRVGFSLSQNTRLHIGLYDVLGHIVENISAQNYVAGSHNLTINMADISAGVYFLKIMDEEGSVVRRVVRE